MRVTVHVHPGSKRPGVGGEHGGALVVRVAERAVNGKATAAVLAAVADAFGLPARRVSLVHGATSRTKVLDVDGGDADVLAGLLNPTRTSSAIRGARR